MAVVAQLILASQSPFRRALLASAGLVFESCAPPVDEYLISDQDPIALAQKRAEAKAVAVARVLPGSLVIGADQTLSCAGKMFTKATTPAEARARLAFLAGKTHRLHSGVALAYADAGTVRVLARYVENISMRMRPLLPEEVQAYVETGEWQGALGCYQYENRGVNLFIGVDGEQSAIVGLPLPALLGLLRGLGINPLLKRGPPWQLV